MSSTNVIAWVRLYYQFLSATLKSTQKARPANYNTYIHTHTYTALDTRHTNYKKIKLHTKQNIIKCTRKIILRSCTKSKRRSMEWKAT